LAASDGHARSLSRTSAPLGVELNSAGLKGTFFFQDFEWRRPMSANLKDPDGRFS
jgi:hypothetical protein